MFEYIKQYYNVPADLGREIIYDGKKKGVIAKDYGNYIGVLFDDDQPDNIGRFHPTYKIEYLETFTKIRKPSRSKQRYQQYLDEDTTIPFGEWLKKGYYKRKFEDVHPTGFTNFVL